MPDYSPTYAQDRAEIEDLLALKLLSGVVYLAPLPYAQLASWARLALWSHGMLYGVALVMAGFRSTLFCWLWWRSRLMPRLLAGLGLAASAWLLACTLGGLAIAAVGKLAGVEVYGVPIFLFELIAGAWLLFRGLPAPRPA